MGRVRNTTMLVLGVAAAVMIPSAGAVASGQAPEALAGLKTVHYRGVTLRIPASWPVLRLTAGTHTCVRFNRHAIYLGNPPLDQACPANALGRTEAILAQPAAGSTGAPEGQLHLVRGGVAITATWGRDPAVVQRALGLNSLPRQPAVRRPPAPTMAPRAAARAASSATGFRHPGRTTYTGPALDTCSAPTPSQLSGWKKRSRYRGMGVYIGGTNASCAQPNLTSDWVNSVTTAGWHLIPIYVGLQAPHNSCGCAPIHLADAAAEGTAAADEAASRAVALGLGQGSPIYYDMEGYTERPWIRNAVLSFLAAWTSELHHDGYRSGVYSSVSSGIVDLVSRHGSGYPEPDDLWFSAWDGQPSTLTASIPSSDWAHHHRAHQFLGPHNLRYGGLEMNVDSDYVDGDTVGRRSASGPKTPSTPHRKPPSPPRKPPRSGRGRHHRAHPTADGALVKVRGSHVVYRMVGGAPLLVKHWQDIGGRRPVRQISRRRFRSLRSLPADGSLIYTITGTTYRIAGGFPFALTRPGTRGSGAQLVDLWDIHHLANPQVHLHSVPSNGTVVHAAPSGLFWAFEHGRLFPSRRRPDAVSVPGSDLGRWLSGCSHTRDHSGGTGFGSCRPAT